MTHAIEFDLGLLEYFVLLCSSTIQRSMNLYLFSFTTSVDFEILFEKYMIRISVKESTTAKFESAP